MYSSCVLSWYTLSKNLIFVFCGAQLGLEMCDTQKVSLANPVFKIFGVATIVFALEPEVL